MSLPAIQFYIGDWMKDSGIRAASLEARGLWVDMLCLMNESPVTGKLLLPSGGGISPSTLARITGVHPSKCLKILGELEGLGVFSRDEEGVIFSRRMIKDVELREQKRLAGLKGGNPNLVKQEVKQAINQPEGVFSSSSIQSSSSLQPSVKEYPPSPSAPAAVAAEIDPGIPNSALLMSWKSTWNANCGSLPKVGAWGAKRMKHALARLKSKPLNELGYAVPDDYAPLIQWLAADEFYGGRKTEFKADFDFLTRSDDQVIKFDEKMKAGKGGQSHAPKQSTAEDLKEYGF